MRPSLKISEPSIPHRIASAHSLDASAFDGSARASSQRSEFMKVLKLIAALLFLGATMTMTTTFARSATPERNPLDASAVASPSSANAPSQNQDNPPVAQPATATPPASGQSVTAGAAPLRVMVGKSLLINTTERLKRISVTDPTVADALVVTPTQVLVNGLAPGEVSLLIWDELERSRSFDLRVDVDITAASEEMHRF